MLSKAILTDHERGKTHLSAALILEARRRKINIIFAFLSYQFTVSSVKILQSLIFQLLIGNPSLRPVLHSADETSYRELRTSLSYNLEILSKLLEALETIHLVVDGLDELPRPR